MTLIIGIDGGGTYTRAVLVDDQLHEYGRTVGGGSNPSAQGWDKASAVICDLIQALLEQTGTPVEGIPAVGIGLAGLTTDREDAGPLRKTMAAIFPGVRLYTHWDVEAALAGAHGKREGVVLIGGTGSGAFGISAAGKVARVGGWGYLIGDEASGYALGSQGLRAVMHAYDGRGPATALTDALLTALDLPMPNAIPPWIYGGGIQPRMVARLAPIVCEAARAGDPTALCIVQDNVAQALDMLRAVLRGLGEETAALALTGGLLTAPDSYFGAVFRAALARELPSITLIASKYPPEVGAAILALDALGAETSE